MSLGPHPDNLRGELSLDQVRAVQEATWPGVQRDLEIGRVREIAEVHVVPVEAPLTAEGPSFGTPVPVAPHLVAMPGRYRAWVLPTSEVAVALEPLDDEGTYLRAYRAHILALQDVTDEALAKIRARVDEVTIQKKNPHSNVITFGGMDNLRVRNPLFSRLFTGVPLRRYVRFFHGAILEPIAPKETTAERVGPYR